MEESKRPLSLISSHSLVRTRTSLELVDKLLLEKRNRDHIKAEYFYNLGLKKLIGDISAIEDFTKAIELDPNNYLYYYKRAERRKFLSDFNGAIEDYTKAIEINPVVSILCQRAEVKLYRLHDNNEAIKDYTKAIELSADCREAYYNRGVAKLNLKSYQEAISDFNKAIELNKPYISSPQEWEPYYFRGLVKIIVQDYKGAIEDIEGSIQTSSKFYEPGDTEIALNDLGIAKYHIKDYLGAIDKFTASIWHGDRYYSHYEQRSEPSCIIPIGDFQTNNFIKLLPLIYPSRINAYYNRGIVRLHLNDIDGAEQDFGRATQDLERVLKKMQNYANGGNL